MKLSSLQENFKNGLQIVGHIAGKNVNLPILSNIMIDARDNNIKLIATDLEIGVVCNVRGKIDESGSFTVEAKLINDYISLLPNKKIDIEKKDKKLFIKSDNHKTSINGQEADEYPLIPQVEKQNYFRAKTSDFKKALSQVIFAVSLSETRAELTGVFFNFNGENLIMAATDSYRLAEKSIKIKTENKNLLEKQIIVPAKTLQEVMRILLIVKNENFENKDEEIDFYISENQILIKIGNAEIISRLVDGQYPDYKQIIPVNKETTIIANRNELARAVKLAAIFSNYGVNNINLDFPLDKNKAIISSTSSQSGENINEVDAIVNGKDNGVVVNYRYLLDGINVVDSENIRIEITNSNTPCILKSEKETDYLYIVMPIKQ